MDALTRRPQLLVKMSPGPKRLTLAAGNSKFAVKAEPLFQSIKDKPKAGFAQAPQWHMVAAADDADEVNIWDLCHQTITGGLGMAAGGRVEFAEPDLEQRWIFGTEAQSLLAAAGSCDKPQEPDSRLPTGEDFYWFRDQAHAPLDVNQHYGPRRAAGVVVVDGTYRAPSGTLAFNETVKPVVFNAALRPSSSTGSGAKAPAPK